MLAVAACQAYLALTAGLCPWLGGGFGMFSTFNRFWDHGLTCEGRGADGRRYVINWDPTDKTLQQRALALPDRGSLQEVGRIILHARLSPTAPSPAEAVDALSKDGLIDRVELSEPLDVLKTLIPLSTRDDQVAPQRTNDLVSVRLTVWRLRFDALHARVYLEPAGEPVEVTR